MHEFQRKQMTAEEIEARQYVEFYRFWAWEYTRRNSEFQEILRSINEAEQYFQKIGIPNFSMSAQALSSPDAIIFYQPHIDRDFSDSEFEIYEKAFFEKMKARYIFGFDINGPRPISKYNSDDILEALQNGHDLERPGEPRERSEGARLIRQREIQKGFKVLYDDQFPIFGYDALVAIDFERPLLEIQAQIENVKEEFELYRKIENDEKPIQLNIKTVEFEKIGIQKNQNIKFHTGTDNSRAIGIWLWDYVQNSENSAKRGIVAQAIRDLRSKFDLSKLGYSVSEDSVFRNWLRKTSSCIDAAEVKSIR